MIEQQMVLAEAADSNLRLLTCCVIALPTALPTNSSISSEVKQCCCFPSKDKEQTGSVSILMPEFQRDQKKHLSCCPMVTYLFDNYSFSFFQADINKDGVGNVCENDDDGDGVPNDKVYIFFQKRNKKGDWFSVT